MPTITAKVLLGWLDRDSAVRFLTTECVTNPVLTDAEAEAVWQPYHDRVQALAPRPRVLPTEYPLNKIERKHAKEFARKAPGVDANFRRIVKVDLMGLAVHQYLVVTERSTTEYAPTVCTGNGWRKKCLRVRPAQIQIPIRSRTANSVVWDIPHNEFDAVLVRQPNGSLQMAPSEWPKWVVAAPCDGRWMLWCGYHRSYARMAYINGGDPEGAEARSVPIVLVATITAPLGAEALARATGLRPALFRDFFDDTLFVTVQLRRKRYELRAAVNGTRFDWSRHELPA